MQANSGEKKLDCRQYYSLSFLIFSSQLVSIFCKILSSSAAVTVSAQCCIDTAGALLTEARIQCHKTSNST